MAKHLALSVGWTVARGRSEWLPEPVPMAEATVMSATGEPVRCVSVRMSAKGAARKSAHFCAPCAATPPRRDQQPVAGGQCTRPWPSQRHHLRHRQPLARSAAG